LLKNALSAIIVLQLFIILGLLTQHSFKKLDNMYNSSLLSSVSQNHYSKDVTLSKIVKEKNIVRNLLNSFSYQRYRQRYYLTLIKKIYKNSLLTQDIEETAKRFLGRPYVWGATGPKCFDCSGFTQMVYRLVGINIPRISKNQAQIGKLVKFDELQKGDMVFFDTSKEHKGKVNHVGIYLGDGKFIHASSGGHKVIITSFNKRVFYKNRFLWGRRVIKEKNSYAFNSILPMGTNSNFNFK
jgi:hypothetical protein